MMEPDPCFAALMAAREEGRYADALCQLQAMFADINVPITLGASHPFITMLEWRFLCELYPSAADALRTERDEQIGHLVRDVHIGSAVLSGLGQLDAGHALRTALLEGLERDDIRALAERDLDDPGAVQRAIVSHQMAQDDHAS